MSVSRTPTLSTVAISEPQLNYIDTGIKLTVTPYKHYGQAVDLVIELSYNTISGYRRRMGMDLPIVASRQSSLTATTRLGKALVFAGFIDQSQHVSIEKVPLLGDLPWIGGLFQRQVSQKSPQMSFIKLLLI